MGKGKKKPKVTLPVAVVSVTSQGDSFGLEIQSDLSEETLAAILRQAADDLEGKQDRAVGAWGR